MSESNKLEKVLAEHKKRLQSRNMFKADAPPPRKVQIRRAKAKASSVKPLEPAEDIFIPEPEKTPEEPLPKLNLVLPEQPKLSPYQKGDNIYNQLIDYFHANVIDGKQVTPVLREEGNCLLATIAASNRISTLIEGNSRSGKSLILDRVVDLLPDVYSLKVCSNKSLFGNAEKINPNKFLYVTEFQASIEGNPAVAEAIKLITEGKDATNDTAGEVQRIGGHLTVLSTGADENKKTRNRDVEVTGRFVLLRTDSSEEKTQYIADYQDGLLMGTIDDVRYSGQRYDKLKNHVASVIQEENTQHINPFAAAYAQFLPTTQKSVYYRTLLHNLVKGTTTFNAPNRARNSEDKLLTNLEDLYVVHQLYHGTYCQALRKLTLHGKKCLEKDVAVDQEVLVLHDKELQTIDTVCDTPVDWQAVWNAGYKIMQDNFSSDVANWVAGQESASKVSVYNPAVRKYVDICEVQQ